MFQTSVQPLPISLALANTLALLSLTCFICQSDAMEKCSECHHPICDECIHQGCKGCELEHQHILESFVATYSPDDDEHAEDPHVVQIHVQEDYPFDYACFYFPKEIEWRFMEESSLDKIYFTVDDTANYPHPELFYLAGRRVDNEKITDYLLLWEETELYTGWRRFLAVYYDNTPLPYDVNLCYPPPLPSL
jgi:hypothetical protein